MLILISLSIISRHYKDSMIMQICSQVKILWIIIKMPNKSHLRDNSIISQFQILLLLINNNPNKGSWLNNRLKTILKCQLHQNQAFLKTLKLTADQNKSLEPPLSSKYHLNRIISHNKWRFKKMISIWKLVLNRL